MNESLFDIVRDALRYRELRKHVNCGYPQPGLPFVSGWETDDVQTEELTGAAYYIREGELDSAMNVVFDDIDGKWDEIELICDRIEQQIIESTPK